MEAGEHNGGSAEDHMVEDTLDLNNLGGFSDWCEIPHTSYDHSFTSGDSGGLTNSPEIPRTSHDHSFRFGDSRTGHQDHPLPFSIH